MFHQHEFYYDYADEGFQCHQPDYESDEFVNYYQEVKEFYPHQRIRMR